ncbi:MAG: GNAT family N-acetyltransferase [Acidilobaceae archaeon]|nr:GNAT family N-acetyltransferase [Acidilobaceae archaeon]MCX8165719.1 GNAT family N-acetyltransferase [Acidilobaceae archaeon]MDW7974144.1 GNAT family N-acetyltransferase [Sulfolobales archaeon]
MVRKARLSDAEPIYKIHLRSLGGVDRETLSWFEELLRLRSQNLKVLVAEKGGEVIGFSIAYRRKGKAYLDYMAVDPRERGKGVGSALLVAMEEMLAREGAEEVSLGVKKDNYGALQFYLNHGYAVKGVVLMLSSSSAEDHNLDGYSVSVVKGGLSSAKSRVMPTAWWSSVTEYVNRRVYRRLEDQYSLLLYRGSKLRGLAEFSPRKKMTVDYVAVSYHKPAEALSALVGALRAQARERGVEEITIPVDGSKGAMSKTLLSQGFKIKGIEFKLRKELPTPTPRKVF